MVLQLADDEGLGKISFKKIWKGIKKFSLAPMRHSFLSLVILNVHHFASRLKKQIDRGNGAALAKKWEKLGGNFNELKKVIEKGAKKKGIADGHDWHTVNDDGSLGVVQVTAVLAAASSVIVALGGFLKKVNGDKEDTGADVTDPAIAGNLDKETAIDPTKPENEPKFAKDPVGSGMDMKKILLFGGLGLGGVLLLSSMRRRR